MSKPWRLRWVDKESAELTHVACGNGFSLFSISNCKSQRGHALYGTGMNTQSQIGVHEISKDNFYKYIIRPVRIPLPFETHTDRSRLKILDIACGREHSVVLTNMGVVTFGSNVYGQCGRPIIEDEVFFGNASVVQNISKNFQLEDSSDSIVSVKAGQDHTCFLTRQGKVLTCGWSSDGQTGQNVFTVSPIPKQIGGDLSGVRVKKLATKGDFVLALSEEGELFGWGNNEYKQLSMCGTNEPQIGLPMHLKLPSYVKKPVLDVAASGTSCVIIDSERNVFIWGYGMLGKGPVCQESAQPELIPNTLFGVYKEIEHTLTKQAQAVYAGLFSTAVVLNDGSLYMWGKNRYGNLGTGDKLDAFIPLRVNIPAQVKSMDCGPDQTFAICKTNV
jgi:alpha-tubulin suppressor-like RCC1 family protein